MQESFRKKIESFTEQWSMVVENLNHECGQQLVELWAEFVNSQKGIFLFKNTVETLIFVLTLFVSSYLTKSNDQYFQQ